MANVKNKFKFFFTLFLLIPLLTSCGIESSNSATKKPSVVGDIKDNEGWYKDANVNAIQFNINILNPNTHKCSPWNDLTAPQRPCTLDDVNHDIDPFDAYQPILGVKFSTKDYQTNVENAVFKIKGHFTRRAPQKAYSIKLNSKHKLFYSQRKFSLAKSESDRSRVKNKLAFDLMREIPNITSLKTQFVHLFINGDDYGLFTQVEAYKKEFLINRGWNRKDNLYNTSGMFFDEWALESTAVDTQGNPLDISKFEQVLEIKNGKDHRALHEMLLAVNSNMDINTVIAKYFNRKNLLTWIAINLLLGDKDTTYHNYTLYNPLNSKTFYFMPWDYDGAWGKKKNLRKYEYGIGTWWENKLTRKFLTIKKNRDDLYALADEIRAKYITDKNLRAKIDSYAKTVRPFQSQFPDNQHNSDSSWKKASNDLILQIPKNIEMYKEVENDPMPFWEYADYNTTTNILNIHWTKSVDLRGMPIVYDVNVSTDPDFNTTILSQPNLSNLKISKHIILKNGTYYFRVISHEKDNSNLWQATFNNETHHKAIKGVSIFYVQ